MNPAIETAIRMLITAIIVSIVIGAIREKTDKYQDSVQNFDIFLSKGFIAILYIYIIFTFGCALGASLMPESMTVGTHEENLRYAIGFIVMGLPAVILIPIAKQKISVRGDVIKVKSGFSTKTYSFRDITHYSGDDITRVYSGAKQLFAFDIDRIGAKNMLDRLTIEGIPRTTVALRSKDTVSSDDIIQAKERAIRKEDVLSITHNSTIITLSVIFLILTIAGVFFMGILAIPLLLGVTIIVDIFIYIIGPLKYYHYMKNMEKALGIDINREMEIRGYTHFRDVKDVMWFTIAEDPYMIILHRDYIKEIRSIQKNSAGFEEISFLASDGHVVKLMDHHIGRFADWYGLSQEDRSFYNSSYWARKHIRKEDDSQDERTNRRIQDQMRENGYTEEQIERAFDEEPERPSDEQIEKVIEKTSGKSRLETARQLRALGMTNEEILPILEAMNKR